MKNKSDRISQTTAQNNVVLSVAADLSRPGEVERVMEQVRMSIAHAARTQLTAKKSATKILTITADLSRPEDIERVVATTLNEFSCNRLISLIDHGNIASQKVALKTGLTYEKDVQMWGKNLRLYAIYRSGKS